MFFFGHDARDPHLVPRRGTTLSPWWERAGVSRFLPSPFGGGGDPAVAGEPGEGSWLVGMKPSFAPALYRDAYERDDEKALLNTDHHRVRTGQVLDTRLAEAGLLHPTCAFRACVVEASRRFDKHIETHHQAESVL